MSLRCRRCGLPFTDANVYSEAGWLETRISGLCETCFDAIADFELTEPAAGLMIDGITAGNRESGEHAGESPRVTRTSKEGKP